MLYVVHYAAVGLWLSFLAKGKTFNVVTVSIPSSIENPIVAKQIYMMSEPCHRYQRIFIQQFSNIYIAEIWIYWAAFVEHFVQIK